MSLQTSITKVVALLKAAIMADYSVCKGIYENDQMAFSAYPVIIVGVPSLLDEDFPVIAQHSARDEQYTIEIVAYVEHADTAANTHLRHFRLYNYTPPSPNYSTGHPIISPIVIWLISSYNEFHRRI